MPLESRAQDECKREQQKKDDACNVSIDCDVDKQEKTIEKYNEAKTKIDRGEVNDADRDKLKDTIRDLKDELDKRKEGARRGASVARGAIPLAGRGHLNLSTSLGPIDPLCELDGLGFDELLVHSQWMVDEGRLLRVLDLPTLITVKTKAGPPQGSTRAPDPDRDPPGARQGEAIGRAVRRPTHVVSITRASLRHRHRYRVCGERVEHADSAS